MKRLVVLFAVMFLMFGCSDEVIETFTKVASGDVVNVADGDGVIEEMDCWGNNMSTWKMVDVTPITGGPAFCQVRVSHIAAYGTNSNYYEFRTYGEPEITGVSINPASQVLNIWTDSQGRIEWRHSSSVPWSLRVTVRMEILNFIY